MSEITNEVVTAMGAVQRAWVHALNERDETRQRQLEAVTEALEACLRPSDVARHLGVVPDDH